MEQSGVFEFLDECRLRGERSVLVTICAVEGSSMRNPGTIMGVAGDGSFAGSLSGGCIENAVVSEALDALKAGAARIIRFGAGSPYLDIKLPCGGGLDLHFQPLQDGFLAADAIASIRAREPFAIRINEGGAEHVRGWQAASFDPATGHSTFGHWPVPKLQIIGHGAGVGALAQLGQTHGCALRVLTPDSKIIEELGENAIHGLLLGRTSQTDQLFSDPWTATIFLFHDHDWEIELMAHALEQPHFYIGAMGGRRAHAFRTQTLLAKGVSEAKIATIRAPIGMFHSSRDPQTLALSTLGEVIRTYQNTDFEAALG